MFRPLRLLGLAFALTAVAPASAEAADPTDRFVVSPSSKQDATHFHRLRTALTTPGLAPGAMIEIEADSFPGSISDSDIDAAQTDAGGKLTIRGASTAAAGPAFSISDDVTVDLPDLHLKSVRLDLIGGNFTIASTGTGTHIKDSLISSSFNFVDAGFTLASSASVLSGNTIVSNNGALGSDVVRVTAVSGSSNVIANNTIASSAPNSQNLLSYITAGVTADDKVSGNRFLGGSGGVSSLVQVSAVDKVKISGNRFSDADSSQRAIDVFGGTTNIEIVDNVIDLKGASTCGICITGSAATTTSKIKGNRIRTKDVGTAIRFDPGTGAGLSSVISDNDLRKNKIGVHILVGGGAVVTGVDLGGGPLSSPGSNDFSDFTSAASSSTGAIVVAAVTADGPVFAKHNLFSVPDPETVIFDLNDSGTRADVKP